MATKTPQESLLELWESIPIQLRPNEPYSFSALSRSVASLVAKAQEASQCRHKDELADALAGIQSSNNSLQELLELTRQYACQPPKDRFTGKMPKPFTGAASDYRRWKSEIKDWAIMNGAAPGNALAAAILRNITGRAKRWALSKQASQYSTIEEIPASTTAILEGIFKDMDVIFIDAGAHERAFTKYQNARQGTRPVFEYNIDFLNIVLELGYTTGPHSMSVYQYVSSLRDDIQNKLHRWEIDHGDQATLTDYMQRAALYDALYPAPKKGRRQAKS